MVGEIKLCEFPSSKSANISEAIGQDWALISIDPKYYKPNSIWISDTEEPLAVKDIVPQGKFESNEVWVCSNSREPSHLGKLIPRLSFIKYGDYVFEVNAIALSSPLRKHSHKP